MSVDSVGSPLVMAASVASGGGVQAQVAVRVLKKSQEAEADMMQQLIASATGVGQRLDVKG